MNLSRRHHYLPQFYLRYFTGDDNRIAVFDLKSHRLWKNRVSTKQIFYRWNRNLFNVLGSVTDFVEEIFKKSDDMFALAYAKILDQNNKQDAEYNDIFNLLFFVSSIYWRIPKTDSDINKLVCNSTNNDLQFTIRNIENNEEAPKEAYRKIMNEPSFIEAYRLVKPMYDCLDVNFSESARNCVIYTNNSKETSLVGDIPVVLKSDNVSNILLTDWIFPLSRNKTLIHSRGKKFKVMRPEDKLMIDTLIFKQSKYYVCGPNADYLKVISDIAEKYNTPGKIVQLKNDVFKMYYQ